MSVTFVFSLTDMFLFLSRYVMFNILLSIFVCATASLFFALLMSAHISMPMPLVDLFQREKIQHLLDACSLGWLCPSQTHKQRDMLCIQVLFNGCK